MTTVCENSDVTLHTINDVIPDVIDSGFPNNYTRPLIWVQARTRQDIHPWSEVRTTGYTPKNELEKKLLSVWQQMITRCYDKSFKSFSSYGGSGMFVDHHWRNAETFIQDAKWLPNWHNKEAMWDTYQLDKDYLGSNCYSRDTCVWLHQSENSIYRAVVHPVHINGKLYLNLTHASIDLGVSVTKIKNLIGGKKFIRGKLKHSDAGYIVCDDYVLRQAMVDRLPQPVSL